MNYSTFSEIEHAPLRIYNRAVMSYNILEDAGRAAVEEYVKNFTKDERMEMIAMTSLVKKHGPKTVKEWVTTGYAPGLSAIISKVAALPGPTT